MGGLLDGFDLSETMNLFKSDTNQAMRTVKSGTLTPIDTTTQRLNDGIALTNDNDTSVKGTITKYKSSIVESLDGIIGAISGGLLNTKDITKAVRIGPDGVTLNDDALITAAGGALGYNVWGKQGVKQLLAETMGKELSRLTGLNLGGLIQVDYGNDGLGGFRTNPNWRGQMGMAVLDMVRDYTGFEEFLDVSVQSSIYNSIIYNAAMYGMSDSYVSLWGNYPFIAYRQDAFIQAIQYMITNGDVISIAKVLTLIDQQGVNTLLNKYPTFIETLFTKFTFDKDALPESHEDMRTTLLDVLTKVAGPTWWLRNTEFGMAYNLAFVSAMSPDMVTLLTPVEELTPLIASRGLFTAESATVILKQHFPQIPSEIK